jgi:hypothetical protein
MASLYGFNAEEIEPQQEFTVLPVGEYRAIAVASENKPTKSGSGSYLEITWSLVDPPYANRQVWSRINLSNPNVQAVEIAKRELSAICRACEIMRPNDSEELHNILIVLKIGQETRKDNGELTNKIKGYKPVSEADAAPAPTAARPAEPTAKMPWKK